MNFLQKNFLDRAPRYHYAIITQREEHMATNEWELEVSCEDEWRAKQHFEQIAGLSFFDMVPDPGGYATKFRENCRYAHARRFQKLVVGQVVKLTNGREYRLTKVSRSISGVDIKELEEANA
jgi:hypothetical protein